MLKYTLFIIFSGCLPNLLSQCSYPSLNYRYLLSLFGFLFLSPSWSSAFLFLSHSCSSSFLFLSTSLSLLVFPCGKSMSQLSPPLQTSSVVIISHQCHWAVNTNNDKEVDGRHSFIANF